MLVVEKLSKSYSNGFWSKSVPAVRDVSFHIETGEAFGLMGKNGSGKSTIARLILGLIKADGGRVLFQGKNLLQASKKDWSYFRQKLQIIFQQPLQALDPKQTVYSAITEPLWVHNRVTTRKSAQEKVEELLALTNLSNEILDRRPHQISGGQAQRVVLARALSLDPEILIADEPTSMLDISVQAQVLSLLKNLQTERGISILLISHDLSVVKQFCNRMAFIDSGEIIHLSQTDSMPN